MLDIQLRSQGLHQRLQYLPAKLLYHVAWEGGNTNEDTETSLERYPFARQTRMVGSLHIEEHSNNLSLVCEHVERCKGSDEMAATPHSCSQGKASVARLLMRYR